MPGVMKRKISAIALWIAMAFSCLLVLPATENARAQTSRNMTKGIVFEDMNRNLKRDAGEKGLQGVLVSNQREVVQTDTGGRYEIPVTDETIIFVTKPAGYAVPLEEDNLPQFYYIHKPKGSPELKFGGVAPTGALPESIDFPLFKTEEQSEFDVLVFADTQPKTQKEVDFVRDDVVAELVGIEAAFGVTLGDIMYDELDLWERQNQIIGKLGIPFYNVPGNHDMNYDAKDDQYSLETFQRHFGPPYFSFDYGKVHFVALDDVDYIGRDPQTGDVRYQGALGEKQLAWLTNDLRYVDDDRLIVFMMHIPFYNSQSDHPSVNVLDREKLFSLVKNRKYLLAIAGHLHQVRHYFLDEKAGWPGEKPLDLIACAAVSGAWWGGPRDERGIPIAMQTDGAPNGYHIFSFKGNQWTEKYYAADKDRNDQMRIISPIGTLARSALDSLQILVNVFDGGARSQVKYRINGAPAIAMQHSAMQDPFFVALNQTHHASYKSFVRPGISDHIWSAPMPKNLPPGMHIITVETTDRHGNTYIASSIFEVQ